MSKRCELQKEYYQQYGNYKGNGKYCDKYVSWLENEVLALRQPPVISSVCSCEEAQKMSEIKLSNYDKVLGFHSVIVKRNNAFKTIQAFYLEMFENTYTLDERLIANRIA